ncbi:MAG TPA: tetratricopeptide repeat protein [Candidatus Cybelea sp.]|nr:tetratricopeptide repeat protein [Candidatus Cybelea sp.]
MAAPASRFMAAGDNEQERTLLFTDIEASTELVEILGARYPDALAQQFELIRAAIAREDGIEVSTHGDELFAIFGDPLHAVRAAIAAQRMLYDAQWPDGAYVRVRMGIHTGRPARAAAARRLDFAGIDVHRAARICNAGHGGQIILSGETRDRVGDRLDAEVTIRSLGTHKLKDIRFAERLFDLVIDGLPSQFAPLRSLDRGPGNLPADMTPFIGRTREKAAVIAMLADAATRMVTITGTGGSGKTRLAIEVARNLQDVFEDGVFLIPTASIGVARLVAPAMAQALGIPEQHGRPVVDIIKKALANRHMLIVIDNFEHVMTAAPVFLDLLGDCHRLKILVTSREALNIPPEHEYALKPMVTPETAADADEAMRFESVELFVDRVRSIRPDYQIGAGEAPVVAEICRRLEGLPLAIELAASRLRLLEPKDLLGRLAERLEVLGRDEWSLAGRHKTMRNAIGWSYNLLNETEQLVFCCAAAFSGGFTVQAMAAVAALQDQRLVTDTLGSLVRKSLLQRSVVDGEVRLQLLDLLKEYGWERAKEGGVADQIRERHLEWLIGLVEAELAPHLAPRVSARARFLVPEADNIRAAFECALETRNAQAISRLLRHLLWFWISRSRFAEADGWISRALIRTGDLVGSEERATVVDVAGWARLLAGDWQGSMPFFQECRLAYQRLGLVREASFAAMMEGITAFFTSADPAGLAAVRESLTAFRQASDDYGIGLALTALGEAARLQDKPLEAEPLFQEALARMRALGNAYWIVAILQNLAHVHLAAGNWRTAAQLLEEALDLGQAADDTTFAHYYLSAMGHVAVLRGDTETAAQLFGAVDASMRLTDLRFEPADQTAFDAATASARAKLGAARYAALFAEGGAWSLEEAIAAAHPIARS